MTRYEWLALAGLAFIGALGLTAAVRSWAASGRMLDVPNARSSHARPTPRGGGLSFVTVVLISCVWLAVREPGDADLLVIAACAAAVAWIGWLDDRRGQPWWKRLGLHVCASLAAVWVTDACLMGGSCSLPWERVTSLVVMTLVGAWAINLFNFMDGIDGLAGMQAAFTALCGSVVWAVSDGALDAVALQLVLGTSVLGFLVLNAPPARIFMGDVGSGFLGFVLFALPLWSTRGAVSGVWPWVILWACFVTDATVTLLRRMLAAERLHEAHRSHLYQRLADRWASHGRVTLAYLGVNLCWLAPLAFAAARLPGLAPAIAAIAYAPLVLLAVALSPDRTSPARQASA